MEAPKKPIIDIECASGQLNKAVTYEDWYIAYVVEERLPRQSWEQNVCVFG